MTSKEIILYTILPYAEGYLEGIASGIEGIENFNKEGAAAGIRKVIDDLRQIRKIICDEEIAATKSQSHQD